MPYQTKSGDCFHMTFGCHGAIDPYDPGKRELRPCATCCVGSEGAGGTCGTETTASDAVIAFANGTQTDEDFEHIKQHPILGYQILSSIKQSPELSVGAHYHHERYDGKGYPDGLKGEEIPVTARIIAVADAYDAMTSTRSYRKELSGEKTKEELRKGMGTQFDPKYAQIMLDIMEEGADRQ